MTIILAGNLANQLSMDNQRAIGSTWKEPGDEVKLATRIVPVAEAQRWLALWRWLLAPEEGQGPEEYGTSSCEEGGSSRPP